ncbi:VanZ family protein [Streptomyces sp. NPDC090088]|uniref:VanZ family protein n=1 Tax=Streptomyces sp. NPDC090088 TaxID=3365944 RepID=UPI0037FFBAE4
MASAASRPRTSKAGTTEETKKDGGTGGRAGLFTRAARVVGVRRAEPDPGPKKATAAKPGGAAKKGKAVGTGRTSRIGKAVGTGKTGASRKGAAAKAGGSGGKAGRPGGKAAAAKSGAERRPLPLPLRLLAMACAFTAMVAFAVVLAQLTLDPSPASVSIAHTNLHPGATLKIYLDQPAFRDAVKQIGGNILLGVPFGILVPVLAPGARSVLRVLALTAIVMLLVELAQGALVTGRAFDVDDVILNTSGALVGWLLLGRRLGRAVHARKRKA